MKTIFSRRCRGRVGRHIGARFVLLTRCLHRRCGAGEAPEMHMTKGVSI